MSLKVLPAYIGLSSIEDALRDPRGLRLLWLEILFNDQLDLSPWIENPPVRAAYEKACCWFTTFRSLVQEIAPRTSLPPNQGPIDFREYRTFTEALRLVSAYH